MTANATITAEQSEKFAELSGDYNPIHVDATAARRLLYGRTVVHGIHTLCLALDTWAQEQKADLRPVALSASFKKPVFAGDRLTVTATEKNGRHTVTVSKDNEIAIKARFSVTGSGNSPNNQVAEGLPEKLGATELNQEELAKASGVTPLLLDTAKANELFPDLLRAFGADVTSLLLSTTRVVGMFCPGLHSLYAGLKLNFPDNFNVGDTLNYQAANFDSRFGTLDVHFSAGDVTGHAECYARPAPVEQASCADLKQLIDNKLFANQQALLVGGSRGLGEYTAKLIAAGGGHVTMTYRSGQQEAMAICDDIISAGGKADYLQLDTDDPAWPKALEDKSFTHIYFFASPRIEPNNGEFNESLYHSFKHVYCDALQALVAQQQLSLRGVFAPSTVYVDEPDEQFREYIQAKKDMEALCEGFSAANTGLTVECPRLPRLRTDQTAGFVAEDFPDTGTVIIPLLDKFAKGNS